MQIEEMPIDELINDPNNARKHGERNMEAIINSLDAFGQQKPIVIDQQNKVVAGNGTLQAAKALGWIKIKAVRTDLKDEKQTAFAIADNRTAELAEWDAEILAKQLEVLGEDVGMTGYDDAEIADMVGIEKKSDVPEVEFSEVIDEANNYIVLVFKNEIDWLQATTVFELKTVATKKQANGKPWSSGIGRVIDGAIAIEKLNGGAV